MPSWKLPTGEIDCARAATSSATTLAAPTVYSIEGAWFRHAEMGAAQRRASCGRQGVKKFMRASMYVPEDGAQIDSDPREREDSVRSRRQAQTPQSKEKTATAHERMGWTEDEECEVREGSSSSKSRGGGEAAAAADERARPSF